SNEDLNESNVTLSKISSSSKDPVISFLGRPEPSKSTADVNSATKEPERIFTDEDFVRRFLNNDLIPAPNKFIELYRAHKSPNVPPPSDAFQSYNFQIDHAIDYISKNASQTFSSVETNNDAVATSTIVLTGKALQDKLIKFKELKENSSKIFTKQYVNSRTLSEQEQSEGSLKRRNSSQNDAFEGNNPKSDNNDGDSNSVTSEADMEVEILGEHGDQEGLSSVTKEMGKDQASNLSDNAMKDRDTYYEGVLQGVDGKLEKTISDLRATTNITPIEIARRKIFENATCVSLFNEQCGKILKNNSVAGDRITLLCYDLIGVCHELYHDGPIGTKFIFSSNLVEKKVVTRTILAPICNAICKYSDLKYVDDDDDKIISLDHNDDNHPVCFIDCADGGVEEREEAVQKLKSKMERELRSWKRNYNKVKMDELKWSLFTVWGILISGVLLELYIGNLEEVEVIIKVDRSYTIPLVMTWESQEQLFRWANHAMFRVTGTEVLVRTLLGKLDAENIIWAEKYKLRLKNAKK
ncbi:hypothetical protein HK098_005975, partial [Nowakowskiella sp. JEL0407]